MNKYRVFSKIAETGNMRKAAKEMMYTQQAVSRIVKCLEDEYGFALFIRERDGVRLTPQAERLIPTLNSLIEEEDKLLRIIEEIQTEEGMTKPIHFVACGSIVIDAVNKTLKELKEKNPELVFGVHYNAENSRTLARLRSGEIDFAIMVGGCEEEMQFEPLFKERYYAVMSKNHPLSVKEEISITDLTKYPNVITPDNSHYEELMDDISCHTVVVDEEIMMLPILSVHDNTVAVMTGIKQFNVEHDLKVLPLVEEKYRVLGVARKANESLPEGAKLFIETLKEIVSSDQE